MKWNDTHCIYFNYKINFIYTPSIIQIIITFIKLLFETSFRFLFKEILSGTWSQKKCRDKTYDHKSLAPSTTLYLQKEGLIPLNQDRFQWIVSAVCGAKDEEIRRPSLWAIRETRLTGKVRFVRVGVRWRWQRSVNEP